LIDRDTQRALKKEVSDCNDVQEKKHIASFTSSEKITIKNEKRSLSPPSKRNLMMEKAKFPPFIPKQLDI
jgi:hypothetical protein